MRNKSPQSAGGKACKRLEVPVECPRCGKLMIGRSYHSYLGHLGLHGLADKYFQGDIEAAQKRLRENGRARTAPFPGNGAWSSYRPIAQEVNSHIS